MPVVDKTKIHQGPGVIWFGVQVPGAGERLTIDANGNPTGTAVVAAPASPGLSSLVAGALAAADYYVTITLVTPTGETTASPEVNLNVAASSELVVQSPPPTAGAIGWNVYVSTAVGTEKLQNAATIPIGTNWTQAAVPAGATSAPITNTTTALYGGAIEGATTVVPGITVGKIKPDQVFGAIDARPTGADWEVEVSLLETDMQKLAFVLPGTAYSTGVDATLPAGFQNYEQITYGGLFTIAQFSIAVISPRVNYPGKFIVSQIYSGVVTKPPQLGFSKEKPTVAKVTFEALALTARPAGDQLGTIWRQP